jgi:hypothetical protein
VNEKKSDTPTTSKATGEIELSEGFAAIGRAFLPGGALRPPSRCDWLLERYPEDFVRALMEGGHCDLRSRTETLPTLDSYPWGWTEMVRTAHALFVAGVAIDLHRASMALREIVDAGLLPVAVEEYDAREKDRELARERKARRTERRMGQPWRKQHR